jgi:hypothetical protein
MKYEYGDPVRGEKLAIIIILKGLDIDECQCGNSRITINDGENLRLEPSDVKDLVACIAAIRADELRGK